MPTILKTPIINSPLSESHRDSLKGESARLRGLIRDASSAQVCQLTLAENLSEFNVACEQALNSLLRVYRESNQQSRSTPCPAYFDEPYLLKTSQRKVETHVSQDQIEAQLQQVDDIAQESIKTILKAREEELDSLPTTQQVLDSLHRNYSEIESKPKINITEKETLA